MNSKRFFIYFCSIVLLSCAVFLASCVSTPAPSRLYVLEQLPAKSLGQTLHMDKPGDIILIMPVRLPPQLKQKGIVIEDAKSKPQILVDHLWASSLSDQIGASLVADLQSLLDTPDVSLFPGPRFANPVYQVETEIIRFSGDKEQFTLHAVTTISAPAQKTILSRQSFSETLPVPDRDYTAYVATASKMMEGLTRDVAKTLIKVHTVKP